MVNQLKVVNINALPQQTVKPLSQGANNIFESGIIEQQNQANLLNSLNSLVGGIRRRKRIHKSRRIKGGAASLPVVVVSGAPSFDPNPKATNDNNAAIASLANKVLIGATYDNTTSQSQVDAIASKQQALYAIKGGNKGYNKNSKSNKKGGFVWGCLSGGKNTKRYKKSCKCHKKKHRKTRKNMKIHNRH